LNKRITILVLFTFLLATFSFLLFSLNQSNILTALVIHNANFDNIEQLSLTVRQADAISFKYNSLDYSLVINAVYDNSIEVMINSQKYTINTGQSKSIDLDKDSIIDLEINVDTIINKDTSLTIRRISCIPDWYCGQFANCNNNMETRACEDLNKCKNPTFNPDLTRPCVATCSDNIKNQEETGVDCGGPCKACRMPTNYVYYWASIPILLAIVSVVIALLVSKSKKKQKNKFHKYIPNNETKVQFKEEVKEEFVIPKKEPKKEIKEEELSFYESLQNQKETINPQPIINDEPLRALRNYIEMSFINNIDEITIKQKLLQKGWQETIVDENIVLIKKKLGRL
jgi:hypothetical protein